MPRTWSVEKERQLTTLACHGLHKRGPCQLQGIAYELGRAMSRAERTARAAPTGGRPAPGRRRERAGRPEDARGDLAENQTHERPGECSTGAPGGTYLTDRLTCRSTTSETATPKWGVPDAHHDHHHEAHQEQVDVGRDDGARRIGADDQLADDDVAAEREPRQEEGEARLDVPPDERRQGVSPPGRGRGARSRSPPPC